MQLRRCNNCEETHARTLYTVLFGGLKYLKKEKLKPANGRNFFSNL